MTLSEFTLRTVINHYVTKKWQLYQMTNLNCPQMLLVVVVHSPQLALELDIDQMQFSVYTVSPMAHLVREQMGCLSVSIFRVSDPIVFHDVFLVVHRNISAILVCQHPKTLDVSLNLYLWYYLGNIRHIIWICLLIILFIIERLGLSLGLTRLIESKSRRLTEIDTKSLLRRLGVILISWPWFISATAATTTTLIVVTSSTPTSLHTASAPSIHTTSASSPTRWPWGLMGSLIWLIWRRYCDIVLQCGEYYRNNKCSVIQRVVVLVEVEVLVELVVDSSEYSFEMVGISKWYFQFSTFQHPFDSFQFDIDSFFPQMKKSQVMFHNLCRSILKTGLCSIAFLAISSSHSFLKLDRSWANCFVKLSIAAVCCSLRRVMWSEFSPRTIST